jgi:integrase
MTTIIGSVFKRKDEQWVARYMHNGIRKQVYGADEKTATRKRQEIVDSLNGRTWNESNGVETYEVNGSHKSSINIETIKFDKTISMSLSEWLYKWLDTWIKPFTSAPTTRGYEIFIDKHIIPEIGSIKLNDLSEQLFQDFFDAKLLCGRKDGKGGGLSKQTLINMRFMLKASMAKAIDENLIPINFMSGIKIKRDSIKTINVLDLEEEESLIKTCIKSDKLILFGIIISLRIGLQIGELLALKWRAIDLENKKIHIRQTLSR